jgi:serine/threonine protein kinase
VLDFGISKLREKDKSAPLTSAGTYLGSPYYMAPEQIADSSTVDARADVYSLGVILYEGLTGAVPYDAESLSGLFVKITNEKPTPIEALRPDVPADLAAVVMKAMAARPEDRYPSVKKLAEALEPFAGGAVFATLDEALGDALGDAIATRRARPAAVEDDAEDALDEEPSELEQAPTKVSRELADELRDTNPPELSDDEVENPGRSTEVSIRPGESVDARDTDPPERDTDPTKTPGGATPRAVAPPPPASRAMAALHGEPGLADLEASPTKPLIRADEVEGAPGAASTGRPASINIATAKTMEMSKPHWDETSMVGRSFAPEAPAKKLPWGAIIGAGVLVAVLTVTIFIVALR